MISRLDGEGAGDADALTLPARQLVRIAAGESVGQADEVEQLGDPPPPLVAAPEAVHDEHLVERATDRDPRVERGVRVLEHHLHAATEPGQGADARAP